MRLEISVHAARRRAPGCQVPGATLDAGQRGPFLVCLDQGRHACAVAPAPTRPRLPAAAPRARAHVRRLPELWRSRRWDPMAKASQLQCPSRHLWDPRPAHQCPDAGAVPRELQVPDLPAPVVPRGAPHAAVASRVRAVQCGPFIGRDSAPLGPVRVSLYQCAGRGGSSGGGGGWWGVGVGWEGVARWDDAGLEL